MKEQDSVKLLALTNSGFGAFTIPENLGLYFKNTKKGLTFGLNKRLDSFSIPTHN